MGSSSRTGGVFTFIKEVEGGESCRRTCRQTDLISSGDHADCELVVGTNGSKPPKANGGGVSGELSGNGGGVVVVSWQALTFLKRMATGSQWGGNLNVI